MFFRIIVLSLLIAGELSLFGQQGEPADPYLHVIEVSTTSRFRDTISTTRGIVDHQSEILIRLDRAEIEQRMLVMQGASRSDRRLQQLYRLNKLLDMQTDILKKVNELVELDQAGQTKPFEKIKELATLENVVLAEVQADTALALEVNDRIEEYILKTISDPQYTFIEWVFSFLTEKSEILRQSFLADLGIDANADSSLLVYFRLGAFVQNKQGGYPIHVENFDSYSPEEYSQSLSFSQPISSEEKDALAANTRSGQALQQQFQLNKLRFQDLLKSNDEVLASKTTYDTLKQVIFSQQAELASLTPKDTLAEKILQRASIDLKQVELAYSLVASSYEVMAEGFSPSSSTIDQVKEMLFRLEKIVDTAYSRYDRGLASYKEELGSSTSGARLEMLSDVDLRFADYRQAVKSDANGLKSFLSRALGILNPLKKNSLANDKFSEKVKRFTLGNLPGEGIITLKTSGTRPGDDIIIKAVLQRGRSPRDRYYEEVSLSRRVLRLERVSAHVKMSGSLILANPYAPTVTSDTVALKNNFQFAPSYTIFMSWGSRKSHFYNQYLGFGLGLGFSSPDFNLDGTPEFGVSVMGTMFQDIISAGWGWNFGVDTPYWYVGFNIPFTVGGIPNLGTSQSVDR
ncbi:MAG: hypothetical protein NWR72_17850 [Bacteroidia bacterium]|nr:hypothetical protein [Bacteroidia bacterium]